MAATILTRELGYRLTDVAKYLKRDPANVSTLMLRLGDKIEGGRPSGSSADKIVEIQKPGPKGGLLAPRVAANDNDPPAGCVVVRD